MPSSSLFGWASHPNYQSSPMMFWMSISKVQNATVSELTSFNDCVAATFLQKQKKYPDIFSYFLAKKKCLSKELIEGFSN